MSTDIGPNSTKIGNVRQNSAWVPPPSSAYKCPKSTKFDPKASKIGPRSIKLGPNRPNLVRKWPNSSKTGTETTKAGDQVWAIIAPDGSNFGRIVQVGA